MRHVQVCVRHKRGELRHDRGHVIVREGLRVVKQEHVERRERGLPERPVGLA